MAFGGGQPKVIPEFTGLQVNTAVQVLPIPIIYGSPRVTLNLIYYNGFNVKEVSEGGKGILSGGKGQKQVEYFATFIGAIGEGPLGQPQIVYQDSEVWTPETYPTNGAFYFDGNATQSPWSYVVDRWPDDARGYKDTAYYAFSNAQIDASATIPQINFVIQGFFTGSCPLNNSTLFISTGQYNQNGKPLSFIGNINLGDADADPAQVIIDFLSNEVYGATFPANLVDTSTLLTSPNGYNPNLGDAAVSTFCQAVGLGWSVVLNNSQAASSILEQWCKNLNVAIVWNGALLRFIPYWDEYASGNPNYDDKNPNGIPPKYYSPYVTPIVTITMDHIIQSEEQDADPITFWRKDPLLVYNTFRLNYMDRANFFNSNTAEAKDEAHIERFGPRIDNSSDASEFSLATYANVSAQMQLRRNISILRNFTWKMGPLWAWLEPMQVVEIPDPTDYTQTVLVRILDIDDDDDENSTYKAEEYPIGSQSPSVIPLSPTTPPNQGAVNVPPSSIYPPVIFAPTTDMLTATGFASPQYIFGASAGFDGTLDTNWGGCYIWLSLDNVSYELVGTLTGPSVIGTLTQPIPGYGGTNPDNFDTIYVNLAECDGALPSVSSALASNGHSICCLQDGSGFEIVAYTTATLVTADVYALTGLYRGLYGTTSRYFGTGSSFLYVSSGANFFETPLLPAYIGSTLYIKAQSFNVFQNATQDLADLAPYVVVLSGPTPVPPTPPLAMQNPTARRLLSIKQNNVSRGGNRRNVP